MHGSGRGGNDKAVAAAFAFAVIIGAFLLVYAIGSLNGRQSERRVAQPHSHAQTAKQQAERACVGADPAVVSECVYDTIEAAEETARTEQDLTAQQRSAWGAMLGAGVAFLGFLATAVGIYYVRETLRATLMAVEDTSEATEAMREQNRLSKLSMRPWLELKLLEVIEVKASAGRVSFKMRAEIHNYGTTPARYVRKMTYVEAQNAFTMIWDFEKPKSVLQSLIEGNKHSKSGYTVFPQIHKSDDYFVGVNANEIIDAANFQTTTDSEKKYFIRGHTFIIYDFEGGTGLIDCKFSIGIKSVTGALTGISIDMPLAPKSLWVWQDDCHEIGGG